MIVEEAAYLDHSGVKGMHWGVRKAPRGDFKSRSKKQKAGLVLGGVAGWTAAGAITSRLFGTRMPISQLAIGGATAVLGVRAARHVMDSKGDTKISDLPPATAHTSSKKLTNKEANRQVEVFVTGHQLQQLSKTHPNLARTATRVA